MRSVKSAMSQPFNYLFLSDLHLSEGINPETGRIQRNEDFFHDFSFAQLLNFHVAMSKDARKLDFFEIPWKLVINGDAFDFLQVVSRPPTTIDGTATMNIVNAAGRLLVKEKKLSENEQHYGLGTTEPEVVWKLQRIALGHPLFFEALGWFVATGNELVLLKGNHDIELYWPAVQTRFRMLLIEGYGSWLEKAKRGESEPLSWMQNLPQTLTLEQLNTAVTFPENYYYEKDLFFVEHGCQSDPANWFRNFADPRLPDPEKKEYIELPSGSLFVRYFFNHIEDIHPFADNMVPITRYLFWVLRTAPDKIYLFLTHLLPRYLRATVKVMKKTTGKPDQNRQYPETRFEERLFDIQQKIRDSMSEAGRGTTIRILLSMGLIVVALVMGLNAVRQLAIGNFIWMTFNFVGALLLYFISSYLFQSINRLLGRPYLFATAIEVCDVLNSTDPQTLGPVPFLIYGHDHHPKIEQILYKRGSKHPVHPQWYVNTGSWVPVFDENDQLLRPDEQLTFFRVVPGQMDPEKPPRLWRWIPGGERPLPIRLFD